MPAPVEFSLLRELNRLLLYTLPALALVWRFLLRARHDAVRAILRPRKRDLRAFLLGLPALASAGLFISLVSGLLFRNNPIPRLESPGGLPGWIILGLSCLATGYLEESYFRFYLLLMLERAGLGTKKRLFVSVMFFSFCHIYEGPGGAINALAAGLLLSAIFIRERSLHGIAWAHGAYNLLAYLLSGYS
jgi:membrane protease YdiL (CAAX protease family)